MYREHGNRTGEESPISASMEFTLLEGSATCNYFGGNPQAGETVGYYNSGKPRFKYPLIDGKMSGIGRVWYETGQLLCEEPMLDGAPHGIRRTWYPDGTLKSESSCVAGYRQGEHKEWHENGRLKLRCGFIRDMIRVGELLHGPATNWYPDGKIKSQVTYQFGRMHGVCRTWSEDGNPAAKTIYVRGNRLTNNELQLLESDTLSAQQILKIKNATVRRIFLEEFGYARFLSQLPHEILERDDDCELIRIDWHKREEPIYLVKVKCPSTGAFYALRVPPRMKTIKEAIAWTFELDGNQYFPEVET